MLDKSLMTRRHQPAIMAALMSPTFMDISLQLQPDGTGGARSLGLVPT